MILLRFSGCSIGLSICSDLLHFKQFFEFSYNVRKLSLAQKSEEKALWFPVIAVICTFYEVTI